MGLRIGKNNFNPDVKLIPIDDKTELYAFPTGSHYHLSKSCPMLDNGQFEKYGYTKIRLVDIKLKQLKPCKCATENGLEKFRRMIGLVD